MINKLNNNKTSPISTVNSSAFYSPHNGVKDVYNSVKSFPLYLKKLTKLENNSKSSPSEWTTPQVNLHKIIFTFQDCNMNKLKEFTITLR